jgi:hypothetical protein
MALDEAIAKLPQALHTTVNTDSRHPNGFQSFD